MKSAFCLKGVNTGGGLALKWKGNECPGTTGKDLWEFPFKSAAEVVCSTTRRIPLILEESLPSVQNGRRWNGEKDAFNFLEIKQKHKNTKTKKFLICLVLPKIVFRPRIVPLSFLSELLPVKMWARHGRKECIVSSEELKVPNDKFLVFFASVQSNVKMCSRHEGAPFVLCYCFMKDIHKGYTCASSLQSLRHGAGQSC